MSRLIASGAIQWLNINRHDLEFTTLSEGRQNRIMAGQNHKPEANSADATREIGIGMPGMTS
jgi:hypothetical protein